MMCKPESLLSSLINVRTTALLITVLMGVTQADAQQQGFYKGAPWSITQTRMMIWDGKPYLPVGWRIPAQPIIFNQISQSGINDVIVELGIEQDWNAIIKSLQELNLKFFIGPNEDAPTAPAIMVRPQTYRVSGLTPKQSVTFSLPHARSAYYTLISEKDFGIVAKGWIDITNNTFELKLDQPQSSPPLLLLVYPRVSSSPIPDYWEQFDARRDRLLKRIRDTDMGSLLRGYVSPMGKVERYVDYTGGILPDSSLFRLEFEAHLRKKYRDVNTLMREWKTLTPDIRSFQMAARLIPLFSRTRGLERLLDPETDRLIPVNKETCAFWQDVQSVIESASARRATRLATAIRQITDVPVIYEWHGWAPLYDSRDPSGQGIGMIMKGTGLEAVDRGPASVAASVLAWQSRTWVMATDLSYSSSSSYPEMRLLATALLDTLELGARGWFVQWTQGTETDSLVTFRNQVQSDPSLGVRTPSALFYPENARWPANTMRLPGGIWWLPTPAAGNRFDLGSRYEGYRHAAAFADFSVIWSTGGSVKTRLLYSDPGKVSIFSVDGQPVPMRVAKDAIEIMVDTSPIIIRGTDEAPVPADAVQETIEVFRNLTEQAKRMGIDTAQVRFIFDDATRQVSRNPSKGFVAMRQALKQLTLLISPYIYIEAENPLSTNWGEAIEATSCSSGRALSLQTSIQPHAEGYYATYAFRPRVFEPIHEVWIAAKIPENIRDKVSATLGAGNTMYLSESGRGAYGDGFAWYRLGRVNLAPGEAKLSIRIANGATNYEIILDAILIAPPGVLPDGPEPPLYLPSN